MNYLWVQCDYLCTKIFSEINVINSSFSIQKKEGQILFVQPILRLYAKKEKGIQRK